MPGAPLASETAKMDLPPVVAAFSRRLREAGLPATADRAAGFARALALVQPLAPSRLYWTARPLFVSDQTQIQAFDEVFRDVFGDSSEGEGEAPSPVH